MHRTPPTSLNWPALLCALRACEGRSVRVCDGKFIEDASAVRLRPSAKGSELCLFAGTPPIGRDELIERLEALAKTSGRRFMGAARAYVNESYLLIESVTDGLVEEEPAVLIATRRPSLGFNASQQSGARSTLRSKRIKTT